ncbi:reverse transcriptase RNA-dependent DNA polymerase [Nitzschia inconspicua]|uniref:Reverse transcriptase RNA-dependent DNA polymerase n=1 Tax=Nitzschia inconspicua TaxID=303405 RepID=A0A9K3PN50_9STRA|nr:reverse transcriptase RNA-dependent DNA polymerase [Nitzschia inconspicua]
MNEKGEGDGSPNEAKNNISANVNDQRRQRSNRRDNGMATGEVNASRFTGSTDGLEKYVYDIGDKKESAENFNRITMKIANYIATNVKDAGEFRRAFKPDVLKFEELVIPTLTEKQKQDTTLVDIWRIDLKECREKMRAREEAKKQAFSIILGQCSMAVTDRLESSEEWESIDESSDVLQLLKLIRKSLYTRSTSKQHTHSLQEAQDRFMLFRQAGHMNVNTYFETFKSLYEAYEHLGGGTGHSLAGLQPFLKPKDPTNVTYQELKDAEKAAREEFLGIRLIRCSDPNRYAGLLADVENSYTRGVDGYPKTLTKAYEMLVNYVDATTVQRNRHPHNRTRQGMSFAQNGRTEAGRGGNGGRGRGGRGRGDGDASRTNADADNNNNKSSSEVYPAAHPSSTTAVPSTITRSSKRDRLPVRTRLAQVFTQRYGRLPKSWMLADSCSSVDIVSNPDLLHDIHEAKTPLVLHCNAGSVTLTHQGYLEGYPDPVWYYPDGIANILSLRNLTRHYRISMDSSLHNGLRLHKCDGTTIDFLPSDTGLYYTDADNFAATPATWALVTTVKEQASRYTKRQLAEATTARRMQNIIMHPSDRQLSDVAIHHLRGCPVTKRSIQIASDVFGPNLGSLKGKTVHRPSPHVQTNTDPVPPEILERHRDVTLATDILFVNKIPFLLTVSRDLRFVTVCDLPNRQLPTVEQELLKVVRLYEHRGFNVTSLLCDPEFEDLRPTFPYLNPCSADEHVPEVERMIRTIKDRIRSVYVTLPYRHLPRLMVKRLVANAVLWWNALPAPDSVSDVHSPRYLLVGRELTYDKHVRLEFGSYVQTHEDHTNDMRQRTLGAICLGPTGNSQGGHYFMSLTSGERIIRHRWTPLPMPEEAIARVSQIGRRQGMPSTLAFSNRHGAEIMDQVADVVEDPHPDISDDDSTYSYHSSASESRDDISFAASDYHDDPPALTADPAIDATTPPPFPAATGVTDIGQDLLNADDMSDESSGVDDDNESSGVDDVSDDDESSGVDDVPDERSGLDENDAEMDVNNDKSTGVDRNVNLDEVENAGAESTDEDIPDGYTMSDDFQRAEERGRRAAFEPGNISPNTRSRTQRRRGQAPRSEHALLTAIVDTFKPETHQTLFCLVTAQMTANKGVKIFGKAGEEAIEKELRQLLTRNVMHGVHSQELTQEQRRAALRYLMFLKEKRCGTIKGRGCADGRKQRLYKSKEETSSPALSIEALLLSCVIDAYERRCVLTCDIPGAFMQADMDELLHLKLDGTILEILLRMEPSYHQFVTYENGKKVLYAQLDKALYGAVQSALLFWKKLSAFVVEKLGFEINPYDACVANKIINGKQFTIAWYVDDLKLSHVDPEVVEEIFAKLQEEFGKEAPLSVTRGKVHNYLGMRIDFSVDGKVQFTMPSLVDEIVAQLPPTMATGPSTTPAANHLFEVNNKAAKLSMQDSDLLHRLTTQLLYLCKRARPDLQTAVAFLTTRVASPDMDDMKKLGRCVRYLCRTAHFPLVLEANCIRNIRWWVDASYAVHPDMRSHTGATMTLGKGSVYSMSTRQKLNTRSSTEAELVGVNDAMSLILWTRHFLEAQGYIVEKNVVYQDNESAILLEKNGRHSSTKRTRHLNVRYFFVTDNVNQGRLSIEYCPTGDMIADYFTKPLQGSPFRKMLKQILNIDDDMINSSPQECVKDNDIETNRMSQTKTGQSRVCQSSSESPDIVEVEAAPMTRTEVEAAATSYPAKMASFRSYADVVRNKERK